MSTIQEKFPCGKFHTDPPRFGLNFNDNGCEWIELKDGKSLKRQVPLFREDNSWKIERSNDSEVLGFLGCTKIPEVLKLNPNPSFIVITFGNDAQASWCGLQWRIYHLGAVQIDQPGFSVKLFKLVQVEDKLVDGYFKVNKGQFTFDQEGKEGGIHHSRWVHWPKGASGVTLGRGFDMKERKTASIVEYLTNAGLEKSRAESFATAAGLQGNGAEKFVAEKRLALGNISPGQQKRLFEAVYEWYENDVIRLCNKDDVVEAYGKTDWSKLNSKIKEMLIDLHYRGDYSGTERKFLQKSVVNNNLDEFKAEILKDSNWPNVIKNAPERHKARKNYFNGIVKELLLVTKQ